MLAKVASADGHGLGRRGIPDLFLIRSANIEPNFFPKSAG
jgi:hypothetical protein